MLSYRYYVDTPLNYIFTGKFKAPTPDWKHETFPLTDYELIVMTDGCLYIADNNGQYKVNKGEHLLLSPTPDNIRYGYYPSDCSFYWLHFTCNHDIIQDNYSKIKTTEANTIYIPKQSILPAPEKVVILMKQLQDSIRSNYNKLFLDYITTTILCEVHNQFFHKRNSNTTNKKCQIYNDIIDYVRLTLTKNIKVSDIAAHFGYNEKYLSHLFSTMEHMPLKKYIMKEKMELAKYMLTDTNDTINQIACNLGYCDSHHFMKTFKNMVGMTPSEYRNAFPKRLLYDK